jgi:hypothetical protein
LAGVAHWQGWPACGATYVTLLLNFEWMMAKLEKADIAGVLPVPIRYRLLHCEHGPATAGEAWVAQCKLNAGEKRGFQKG